MTRTVKNRVVAHWIGGWHRYMFDYNEWKWMPMIMSHRTCKEVIQARKPIQCPRCHSQSWRCYDERDGYGYMACNDCNHAWME